MIMIMIQNVKCRGYESSPHLGSSLRGPGEFGGGRRQATEYASVSAKFAAAAGVVCGGFCVFCVFCVERLISHGTTLSVVRARTCVVSSLPTLAAGVEGRSGSVKEREFQR